MKKTMFQRVEEELKHLSDENTEVVGEPSKKSDGEMAESFSGVVDAEIVKEMGAENLSRFAEFTVKYKGEIIRIVNAGDGTYYAKISNTVENWESEKVRSFKEAEQIAKQHIDDKESKELSSGVNKQVLKEMGAEKI